MSLLFNAMKLWRWSRIVAMTCGVVCVLMLTGAVTAADGKRPNILFAFADDWGRYASIFATVFSFSPSFHQLKWKSESAGACCQARSSSLPSITILEVAR